MQVMAHANLHASLQTSTASRGRTRKRGPQMYKHILVAVGTRPDSITLEAAIRLAHETGARVTALHVVDPVPPYAGAETCDFSATFEALDAYGHAVEARCLEAIHQSGCEGDAR